ncbi:MAG TPA: GNAT family N-acetyltransferase [Aridibacter sp.]|nr:GNAT family N-acetyltransferase [Aridibacter sp.]
MFEIDEVTVSRLTSSEASRARTAVTSVFGESASGERLSSFLSDKGNYLLVAESEGSVGGILLAYRLERIKDQGFKIFLYEIEVSDEMRRSGLGRSLISELLSIARAEGARSVFGITNRTYPGAREFYLATGAVIVGEEEILFAYSI